MKFSSIVFKIVFGLRSEHFHQFYMFTCQREHPWVAWLYLYHLSFSSEPSLLKWFKRNSLKHINCILYICIYISPIITNNDSKLLLNINVLHKQFALVFLSCHYFYVRNNALVSQSLTIFFSCPKRLLLIASNFVIDWFGQNLS